MMVEPGHSDKTYLKAKKQMEQLYGMKESDFIKYATPMDSRTQKI